MTDDATTLRTLGWRQGSILPRDLVEKLEEEGQLLTKASADQIFIVVSHDCDVLNASFEKESFVELIAATPRQENDGALRYGKNPRRIIIEVSSAGTQSLFELSIDNRYRISRETLLGHSPDPTQILPTESLDLVIRWIVKRYFRAAFPDTFNLRLQAAHKRLRAVLSNGGTLISGIYLRTEEQELSSGQGYHVFAEATMPVVHFENAAARETAQECLDGLVAVMNECDGIVVDDHYLVSEADFSLHEQKQLRRWDWDSLSLREDPPGELTRPE